MPLMSKTILLARLTLTTLTSSNKPAPAASVICPEPNINPIATAGGNKATATITPTKTLESPVVKESAAAAPDAKAKTAESSPTLVREISS